MADLPRVLQHGLPSQAAPLAGWRILVTRPEDQAAGLMRRLTELGGEPLACPTIRIVPPASTAPLDAAIRMADVYAWIIFTSVNGVRFFCERLAALGHGPEHLAQARLAAIGPATARALAENGLRVDLVPKEYVAEAILAEIGEVAAQHILLPRADIARKALAEGLAARGARVDEVVAYRTEAAGLSLPLEPIHLATFTSPSTVRSFVSLVEAAGDLPSRYLAGACIACIGPITAEAAAAEGLAVDITAQEHTVDGLIDAILSHLAERAP